MTPILIQLDEWGIAAAAGFRIDELFEDAISQLVALSVGQQAPCGECLPRFCDAWQDCGGDPNDCPPLCGS